MKKIYSLFKKLDIVLLIAWLLAIISSFIIAPGREYLGYIDLRSLGILWGLMVVIQGFKENSVFVKIAGLLLSKVGRGWQLAAVLIYLCFFTSMFITNDVALITFVPFALMILSSCKCEDMMIPTVVLQTVAANLGSMLTPIGNPQNLYLYGLTGMGLMQFVKILLPYSLISAVLLGVAAFIMIPDRNRSLVTAKESAIVSRFGSLRQVIIYSILFAIAILSVVRVLPWYVFCLIVLVVVGGMDYKILFRADYVLLMTFIGFFIFTGNMARIDVISLFLQNTLAGREFPISIALSQVISNVPATLMLSGFTDNYGDLLLGVNIGGLGTLIASMASLISYKAYTGEYRKKRGRYILTFTVVNLAFLAILVGMYLFLKV